MGRAVTPGALAASLRSQAAYHEQRAKELREEAERLEVDHALGECPDAPELRGRGLTEAVFARCNHWVDAGTVARALGVSRPEIAAVLSRLKGVGRLEWRRLPGPDPVTEYRQPS